MTPAFQRSRPWIAVLIATGLGPVPALGVTYEALFKEARERFESVYDQVEIERKVCEEELALGVEQKRWSDEVQKEGVAWLDNSCAGLKTPETVFSTSQQPSEPLPRFARGTIDPWPEFMRKVKDDRGETTLTNPVCKRFVDSVALIGEVRGDAIRQMHELAIPLCEEVWIKAEKPADLAIAVEALNLLRRLDRARWSNVATAMQNPAVARRRSQGAGANAESPDEPLFKVVEFWAVLSGNQPFLLPNPEKQPGEFRQMREDWEDLRRIKHGFVLRPRIASHFAALDRRYSAKVASDRRELEKLMQANAPAVEFEKVLNRFPEKRPIGPRSPSPVINFPQSGQFDYRGLFAMRPRPTQPGQVTIDQSRVFSQWLAFKQAEELGDADEIERSAELLRQMRNELSPEASAFLAQRLEPKVNKAANAAAPKVAKEDPIQALITALQAKPDSKELAQAWGNLANSNSSPETAEVGITGALWTSLAANPENLPLFDLREHAARQALAVILNTTVDAKLEEQPVEVLLADALEESCAKGLKSQTLRLLALDRAYYGLTRERHSQYREIANHLPPETPERATGVDQRANYRFLLTQGTSPGAASYAAEQLKKLRKR